MAAKKLIARGGIASIKNTRETRVLQKAATSLQHDRMVVYDENAGHVFFTLDR